jgi:alcohol dehydrogenase YqhD (iron-dependent ADH family)
MVLERAIGQNAERDQVLAQALGVPLAEAPRHLAAFIEGLGVKTRFADYGVDDEEAQAMLAHALQGARGKNFIGNASLESIA